MVLEGGEALPPLQAGLGGGGHVSLVPLAASATYDQ